MNWRGARVIVSSVIAVIIAFIYGCVVAGYVTMVWSVRLGAPSSKEKATPFLGLDVPSWF
jgi:ABC-type thiamin/hydroxymethylpyrimidine transport system permease subunit